MHRLIALGLLAAACGSAQAQDQQMPPGLGGSPSATGGIWEQHRVLNCTITVSGVEIIMRINFEPRTVCHVHNGACLPDPIYSFDAVSPVPDGGIEIAFRNEKQKTDVRLYVSRTGDFFRWSDRYSQPDIPSTYAYEGSCKANS